MNKDTIMLIVGLIMALIVFGTTIYFRSGAF